MKVKDWIGLSMLVIGFFVMDSGMTQYSIKITVIVTGVLIIFVGALIFVRE